MTDPKTRASATTTCGASGSPLLVLVTSSGDEMGRCCLDVATAPMTRQRGHHADSEARDHQKPGSDAHTEGSDTSKPQHDDQTCGSCDADQLASPATWPRVTLDSAVRWVRVPVMG
ncbi:hypothetical protein [Actinomarinicola tropica]|uniref:Uncharacterized protein n=1 Tax=Actinomarinicola tropica TaxID=2789776 RepID=A0A5Q2RES3_9ACTN|nr:hypothetical protein [Actinomarinicola tropica]QGG94163.1 hypothetical protein GH723_03080 [Actinomarinicola tropica]